MTETATGVLQLARNFRSQALINLGQAVLTALMIVVAFFTRGGYDAGGDWPTWWAN